MKPGGRGRDYWQERPIHSHPVRGRKPYGDVTSTSKRCAAEAAMLIQNVLHLADFEPRALDVDEQQHAAWMQVLIMLLRLFFVDTKKAEQRRETTCSRTHRYRPWHSCGCNGACRS